MALTIHNELSESINIYYTLTGECMSFIDSNATVLELGADYGRTAWGVNQMLTTKTRHVVYESRPEMEAVIKRNREAAAAKFQLHMRDSETINLAKLQELYEMAFDTLIVNEENYIDEFLAHNDLSNFKTIIVQEMATEQHKLLAMQLRDRQFYECLAERVYMNMRQLPLEIISHVSGHIGSLGLHGRLGYVVDAKGGAIEGLTPSAADAVHTVSMHGPGHVIVKTRVPLTVYGMLSRTSLEMPTMTYYRDGQIMGLTYNGLFETKPVALAPGYHRMEIMASPAGWSHGVFVFKEVKVVTPVD